MRQGSGLDEPLRLAEEQGIGHLRNVLRRVLRDLVTPGPDLVSGLFPGIVPRNAEEGGAEVFGPSHSMSPK
jgi:hypothetical protein